MGQTISRMLADRVAQLRATEKDHIEMGQKILKAHGGDFYHLDYLVLAVLNRSLCLIDAFCILVEKRNFIAAAPLLRLQLDNLLRFRAAWLVDKPHDFAFEVLKGTKVRDMKDRTGHDMTDNYLVQEISKKYPELKNVYEQTSGYIHLSEKHIFNSMRKSNSDGRFEMKVSRKDAYVPDEAYLEATAAFFHITGILFSHLQGWAVSKASSK